jgi:hypothetical protein
MKQILTSKIGKVILVVFALLLLTGTVLAGGGGPYISRSVIGGGGGHSEMGRYVMDATVGQAVVGTFSHTPYELCAGFWCGMGEYKVYLPVVLRN